MSKFVSGGTIDEPAARDDEWKKAQQEIEEKHKAKLEAGKQEGGKSLYEVLQANKAAKQEQFEESIRLKNQFRSLAEDEAEFLDNIHKEDRAKQEAVRKETSEQLEAFRKQQEEVERKALAEGNDGSPTGEEEQWTVGSRKRKKGREKEGLKGVKLRKSSSAAEKPDIGDARATSTAGKETSGLTPEGPPTSSAPTSSKGKATALDSKTSRSDDTKPVVLPSQTTQNPAAALGLGNYSSDDD